MSIKFLDTPGQGGCYEHSARQDLWKHQEQCLVYSKFSEMSTFPLNFLNCTNNIQIVFSDIKRTADTNKCKKWKYTPQSIYKHGFLSTSVTYSLHFTALKFVVTSYNQSFIFIWTSHIFYALGISWYSAICS